MFFPRSHSHFLMTVQGHFLDLFFFKGFMTVVTLNTSHVAMVAGLLIEFIAMKRIKKLRI